MMISVDLLDVLRKSDPVLWEKFREFYWIEEQLESVEYDCDEFGHRDTARMPDNYHDAVLQAYIQGAIRARGWYYSVWNKSSIQIECIIRRGGDGFIDPDYMHIRDGSTEAEALLEAYLQAIKESTSA